MNFEEFQEIIRNIAKRGKSFKPHKYLALLAVIDLIKEQPEPRNIFRYDELFREKFTKHFEQYHGPNDKNRPLAPFFHLKNAGGFWFLKALPGKETVLENLKTVGAVHDLHEAVDYAYLDPDAFQLLRNSDSRRTIINTIHRCLEAGLGGGNTRRENSKDKNASRFSLFQHEALAIESIDKAVQRHRLGRTVSNLVIYDAQTNDYYECDLIVASHSGIYVVELKHWSGHIRIAPYNWVKDGVVFRRDPHTANLFKAKILKGIYQHQFRTYPDIWVESVVILTNPDAEVEEAAAPKTDKHCPTFDSIDRFIDYLRYRRRVLSGVLTDQKIGAVVDYLESLRQPKRGRQYSLPGYEVVEHLTQRPDLIELVARPTDGRCRTLKRFRIFSPPYNAEPLEKERFILFARNTLDAVSRIGDQANILKVWPVPNESGALIEGSDWSEEGTLRDLLNSSEEPFKPEEALRICSGILRALEASHKEDVVHRAVKPENVLILNGVPKLMNFELSYQLEKDRHITVIPDASVLKRDAYTAPEVLRGEDVDERTDLFSVGVILYELLTGERPFKTSMNLEGTGGRLTKESLKKLELKHTPKGICDAIDRMVRFKRTDRLRNAEDALAALDVSKAGHERPIHLCPLNQKLEPGVSYDVYTIERLIREGVEAQIYEALTVGAQRVVLKIFNRDIPLNRIQNEERATSAVRSSYLVNVKRLGHWDNDRYFLELNFIDGRPMREDINTNNQPDVETFTSITSCLLQAVHTLHHRHEGDEEIPLLHSDIKPDNIMLTPDGSAVLIDFGAAGLPRVDSYQGTDGYVAPDLMLGSDLQFCESGDLFALGVSLFEWLYGRRPYETPSLGEMPIDPDNIRTDVPQRLQQWLLKSVQTAAEDRFKSIEDMKTAFITSLKEAPQETEVEVIEQSMEPVADRVPVEPVLELLKEEKQGNPFVLYLNSLHNATANNENAIAENQSTNSHFVHIHVPSKVTEYIYDQLTMDGGCSVILTGNAGDGKTTIGLELFKRLKGIPHNQVLPREMRPKEAISLEDRHITLIKDMSELSEKECRGLLADACEQGKRRYFIISNTGALLNGFEQLTENKSVWCELQSDLLKALEAERPQIFNYKNGRFRLINLVRVDNIDTACEIFSRMLDGERWGACKDKTCSEKCPIYQNVKILQASWETIRWRVELVYRRMFQYGCRLTLRQMTGHLAYAITAGLNYDIVKRLSGQAVRPPLRYFLFFNRFFGDCGDVSDPAADQLPAIREIRNLEPGCRPQPKIDRLLWMKDTESELPVVGDLLKPVYNHLRSAGAGRLGTDTLTRQSARIQTRRLLYCYGQFDSQETERDFISTFLNSPMLVDLTDWQHNGSALSLVTRKKLKRSILHVLQEHFTGVRLPENTGDQETLYITLNRHSYDVRQSAQIVLAKFLADDFDLILEPCDSAISGDRYQLKLREKQNANALTLDLPFLDYVTNRHHGEIAQQLQSFYVDRLERFKVGLLADRQSDQTENMMVVRLQLNHTFKSQIFSIHENIMEVI